MFDADWATVWCKNYDDMLSRFHLIPERYGQTDRQTDRFAISISRVSMLTRDKNRKSKPLPIRRPNVERPFDFGASVYGAKATKSTMLNSTLSPVCSGFKQ